MTALQNLLCGLSLTACTVVHGGNISATAPRDRDSVHALPPVAGGSLRWPNATWSANGWVVAANIFPNGADKSVPHRSLYLVHTRTGLLPLPEGDFLFAYPMPIATPDGVLHLFWAEGPPSSTPDQWPYSLTSIWHAAYVAGRWSLPDRVVGAQYVSWEPRAPQIVVDDQGRLHVVTNVAAAGQPDEIVQFTLAGRVWKPIRTGDHGGYPAIASLGSGHFVLVSVRGDNRGKNQLYERMSADYGESWTASRRILDSLDFAPAYEPQLRVAGTTLSLAWLSGETSEQSTWRVTHRPALDGQAWALPLSIAVRGRLLNAPFTLTECGSPIGLLELIAPDGAPVVREVRARTGRLVFEHFPDSIANAPTTSRFASSILEVWNRVSVGGHGFTPYWRQLSFCGE